MKKVALVFASVLFVTSMALTSCTEKEEVKPDNPTPADTTTPDNPPDTIPQPPTGNYLMGTSWTSHVEGNYTYNYGGMDIYMEITDDASLDFLDETHGELFQDLYVYFPAYPSMSQSETDTEPFTYEINGNDITLNASYYDEEEEDTIHYSYPATYDPVANTITVDMTGTGMDEVIGTNLMVFTPREDATKAPRAKAAKNGRPDWRGLLK